MKDPSMKRRCPKLVPGQVIELPANHNLARQPSIEIVRRVEKDEVLRPWVYDSAEDAVIGNPNKSRLSPDQIEAGLSMSAGAIANRESEYTERQKARSATKPVLDHVDEPEDEDDETGSVDEPEDDEEDESEDEEANAKRSRNRATPDVYKDAKPIVEDEPEVKPAVRRGRRSRG